MFSGKVDFPGMKAGTNLGINRLVRVEKVCRPAKALAKSPDTGYYSPGSGRYQKEEVASPYLQRPKAYTGNITKERGEGVLLGGQKR